MKQIRGQGDRSEPAQRAAVRHKGDFRHINSKTAEKVAKNSSSSSTTAFASDDFVEPERKPDFFSSLLNNLADANPGQIQHLTDFRQVTV